MKNVYCEKCKSKMKLIRHGNVDLNKYKQENKSGKWTIKKKVRTLYGMIFKCPVGTCDSHTIIQGESKAEVLKRVNGFHKEHRDALIKIGIAARKKMEKK